METLDAEKLIITSEDVEKRIAEGIEKNRKGNFRVSGLTAGQRIRVKLKKHLFRFGANLFMLDEFPDDAAKNGIYREKFAELFNTATLPLYWYSSEPEEGKTRYEKNSPAIYRRPPTDRCVEYCLEKGIEPREHGLCYTHAYPAWLKGKSFQEFLPYLERRMKEISDRYARFVPTMEVLNEMLYTYSDFDFYFTDEYAETCYKLADKYFPNNKLTINEWIYIFKSGVKDGERYFDLVKRLLEKGCRIDEIGIQYHVFEKEEEYFDATREYYDLARVFAVLDKFATFGKKIEITEITIPAYCGGDVQADMAEKLYSLWFSHPAVEKIIYWNLVDGYAAHTAPGNMEGGENRYRGGLLNFDMSEKPIYKRLKYLINEKWNTDEILTADENGNADFRGFYGDYEILTEDGAKICEKKFYDKP